MKPGLAPAAEADSNNYKKPRKPREADGAGSVQQGRHPGGPGIARRLSNRPMIAAHGRLGTGD
jgi:hypothetical protein